MRHAGLQGEPQGFRVHIGEHEDLPVARVPRYAGDQPIGIEARRERNSFFQFAPPGLARAGTERW